MSEENAPDDGGRQDERPDGRPAGRERDGLVGWSGIDADLLRRSASLPGFRQIAGADQFPARQEAAKPPVAATEEAARAPVTARSAPPVAEAGVTEEQWWPRAAAARPSHRPAEEPATCEDTPADAAMVQARLGQRLAAIERNLSRIADALERRGLEAAEPRGTRLRDLGIAPRVPVGARTEPKPKQEPAQVPVPEAAAVVAGEAMPPAAAQGVSQHAGGPLAPAVTEPYAADAASRTLPDTPRAAESDAQMHYEPDEAVQGHSRERWITVVALVALAAGIVALSPGRDIPEKLQWLSAALWRLLVAFGILLANLGDAVRAAFAG